MICEKWDPFKKNKREALIKKMVLKRLGDEIRVISYQKFAFTCQNDVLVDLPIIAIIIVIIIAMFV